MPETIPLVDLISGNGPQYQYCYEVKGDNEEFESVVYENITQFKIHLLIEVIPGLIFGSQYKSWQLTILRRLREIDDDGDWEEWIQVNGRMQ